MADAKNAKPSEEFPQNDSALLAVETSEPVILQEPDRMIEPEEDKPAEMPLAGTPKAPKQKSGFIGFVLGGAIVAGAGFGVAKYAFPETGMSAGLAELQTQLDAKDAEFVSLRTEIAELAARPVAAPDAALADRIAAVEQALAEPADTSAVESRLAQLEERLAAIEAASVGGDGAPAAALAAMDREMNALRAEMEAQKGAGTALSADIEAANAAAQARLDAAEAAAQTAAKQAALSHVRAAFESGAPLAPAFEGLTSLDVAVPDALLATTESLPTLLALRESFAEPARAALDASIRADMGEAWTDRLSAFLRSQSGARSLTPREGTDPDAVLSRAEAALRSGDLKTVLAELAGLPPAGAEAMAGWVAEATRRLDAETAIADLSATLNGQ